MLDCVYGGDINYLFEQMFQSDNLEADIQALAVRQYVPAGMDLDMLTHKAREQGVAAFFSSALALTLDFKYAQWANTEPVQLFTGRLYFNGDRVVLCDYDLSVDNPVNAYLNGVLAAYPNKRFLAISHQIKNDVPPSVRLEWAQDCIHKYAVADLVITTRMSCALACLALKTPVILVLSKDEMLAHRDLVPLMNHICVNQGKPTVSIKFDRYKRVVNPKKYERYANQLKRQVSDFICAQKKPLPMVDVLPAFDTENMAVVFSANNDWAPYLAVTIQSLIAHASAHKNYDIIVFQKDISALNQKRIQKMVRPYANVRVRFFDMNPVLNQYRESDFYLSHHIKLEAYFRIFIPNVLVHYNQVVYLDTDLIVLKDIAHLFEMKVDLLAAAPGLITHCHLMTSAKKRKEATKRGIKHLDRYFNSGVLVMNLKAMRAEKMTEKMVEIERKLNEPHMHDQTLLNIVANKRVQLLDLAWNFSWMLDCRGLYNELLSQQMYKAYQRAECCPYIMHYMGLKPWQYPQREYGLHFWRYARQTPFFRDIIRQNYVYLKPHFLSLPSYLYLMSLESIVYAIRNVISTFKYRWKKLLEWVHYKASQT